MILFDPIFQGLAISLMAGELASLVLWRMTVPVVYYLAHARRQPRLVPAAVVRERDAIEPEMRAI